MDYILHISDIHNKMPNMQMKGNSLFCHQKSLKYNKLTLDLNALLKVY
jgi:hypothetical protein